MIASLRFDEFSIIDACLKPLSYDKMITPDDEIQELIKLSWNLHKKDKRGITNPRYSIAAAYTGWNKELTKKFLAHCLKTAADDVPLKYVAGNSLKIKCVRPG